MPEIPITLTLAGSDSSAGAGLQADLKTFQHFRTFGLTVPTCIVAETPREVRSVHTLPLSVVRDQLDILLETYPVAAIKTGMLPTAEIVELVANRLSSRPEIPLVVDPVMIASTGTPLVPPSAIDAYRNALFPRCQLLTPNLDEAAFLIGESIADRDAMERAAIQLANELRMGAVLLKGGHLHGPECADLLHGTGIHQWFIAPRMTTAASHGTGCTLSAALAALLALGRDLPGAVAAAKSYLGETLARALSPGGIPMLNQGTTFDLEDSQTAPTPPPDSQNKQLFPCQPPAAS
ncbi:hydroxymethylpyrimidine/phosphomethylpyrimidine kinase [Haloferula luteola]|uniref:hydroxymethylpyrimidine kinase n=1 Tax=Haloferula luteola TaxID=595692 RepID=A0A840VCD2_9BACT|nr:bifunctional hydroxymethylpyrimidine kinase/phosphomethylpyrimidine kinase [Haloferula luteola]MBB5352318.1 hydroxymethylpyrimidine/phosphomethylpyrimidine kinase [Haloferula luteola]